ncbi:WD40-repeat-containing domain protein [Dichotomopilus funicola]|uniref:WD40-repeat-containing domain protein n=1 Tax=Dichotomopilus funicola TaxID=1934379 RepID=A0AAN6UZU3_9PEZI|nr:WD40-repeat-containing domain protein [Dichotomopilus funicola]
MAPFGTTSAALTHPESTTAHRTGPVQDWVFAPEATNSANTNLAVPTLSHEHSHEVYPHSRLRSMSVSLPWKQRPKSALLEPEMENMFQALSLEKSKSHAFGGQEEHQDGYLAPTSSKHGNFKKMLRRASVSLKTGVKGFIHRRTSVPATSTFDHDGRPTRPQLFGGGHNQHNNQAGRPTTSHFPWNRLRQRASFHRHPQSAHPEFNDHVFLDDLGTIESPTLPVPGSGEQPPIIPRNTGAAARHAAAIACNGLRGYDLMDTNAPFPHPGWLAAGDAQDDRESGIGIAPTCCDMDAYVPGDEVDSDVDVGSSLHSDEATIVKVDFVSKLPVELSIQILALLDAPTLNTASRVSSHWNRVIKNQHIWRESFLREQTTTYATSGPVKPGVGLGVPQVQPSNDWKEIYRVKTELDQRWREGKARPVYLNGHTDSIYCLQFDESKIITGSRDRTIRVWDMHTFACKLVIGPPEVIHDGPFSILYDDADAPRHHATIPDLDPTPTADGQPRAPIRAYHSVPALYSPSTYHKASILCLQYDDEILVTGSSDFTCIVYSIAKGYQPVRRLRHHSAAVLDLVFDDKHIVTCSKDVSICVWDRATGALLRQLRGHSGPVNAVQMRGNTIVSCSGDFKVKLWNIDTGKNIREFLGHSKGLACSQFSEDGRYVASAGNDKVIRVWDANTGEFVREMQAHDNLVRSLHVDSVSGRLVSASYDSDIKVWDMETGQPLLDFPKWHSSWVLSAKSDYRRIVSSGQDPKILILDFGAGVKGVEMLESPPPPGGFDNNGKRLESGVEGPYI